ncbi:MAG: hypothetical protein ACRD5B_14605 [Nitrososphaeraceae archaeon]
MTMTITVRPLEKVDVTRIVLRARQRLEDNRSKIKSILDLRYYCMQALLELHNSNGIYCHRCRHTINLGELFAKKNQG